MTWKPGFSIVAAVSGMIAAVSPIAPAVAGPPYETDDPEPTETRHWEIYAFTGLEGGHGSVDGVAGFDLNYGPLKSVQLTATLPVEYSNAPGSRWKSALGDVELGVKYRFVDAASKGFSMAIFPRVVLPTSTMKGASNRARVLLPVWAQKDMGKTVIFGGGGYEINPGPGNRNFWLAGAAITRAISDSVTIGGEATHRSPDAVGGSSSNGLGVGAVVKLKPPFSILLSGGPTWSGGQANFHAYAALGLNL